MLSPTFHYYQQNCTKQLCTYTGASLCQGETDLVAEYGHFHPTEIVKLFSNVMAPVTEFHHWPKIFPYAHPLSTLHTIKTFRLYQPKCHKYNFSYWHFLDCYWSWLSFHMFAASSGFLSMNWLFLVSMFSIVSYLLIFFIYSGYESFLFRINCKYLLSLCYLSFCFFQWHF